ncbi:HalOD1 output domain-containing protein [Natrinema salinisoli]|uniref:HalOD1 output domain-containing protein n=1 Tax=Natrinema salinisoli TaxID=2878535 RepID=UPI001CEFE8DF|nr:HalOD1 output domain-containing protein [Natrinema salinisoli]
MGQGGSQIRENSVIHEIIKEVSDLENCDYTELPPLHDSIDTDALERVATSHATIHFTYCGYKVTVKNGNVIIDT